MTRELTVKQVLDLCLFKQRIRIRRGQEIILEHINYTGGYEKEDELGITDLEVKSIQSNESVFIINLPK